MNAGRNLGIVDVTGDKAVWIPPAPLMDLTGDSPDRKATPASKMPDPKLPKITVMDLTGDSPDKAPPASDAPVLKRRKDEADGPCTSAKLPRTTTSDKSTLAAGQPRAEDASAAFSPTELHAVSSSAASSSKSKDWAPLEYYGIAEKDRPTCKCGMPAVLMYSKFPPYLNQEEVEKMTEAPRPSPMWACYTRSAKKRCNMYDPLIEAKVVNPRVYLEPPEATRESHLYAKCLEAACEMNGWGPVKQKASAKSKKK